MHPEYKKLTDNYHPLLAAVIIRDGYQCVGCGNTPRVLDHIVPVKRHGKTALDNLQLLCQRCNGIKGNEIADYRPSHRGNLGREHPRHTSNGDLIVRISRSVEDESWGHSEYVDSIYISMSKSTIRIYIPTEDRTISLALKAVYPPDLQHLYSGL
jgi:hypothetical protein